MPQEKSDELGHRVRELMPFINSDRIREIAVDAGVYVNLHEAYIYTDYEVLDDLDIFTHHMPDWVYPG